MTAEIATLRIPASLSAFSIAHSGRLAAAACDNEKLYFWSLPDGHLVRSIDVTGHHLDIVVLSADGAVAAAGDHTGGYTIWDAATGAELARWKLPYYPIAMAFSPDGKCLAIASANQAVQVYNTSQGRKLLDLPRSVGGSQAVAFSPDGKRLASADSDTVVRVFDARNGEILVRYSDFLMEPLAIAFSPDGKRVLSGGGDKIAVALDVSSGRPAWKTGKVVDPPIYMDFSPDGSLGAMALMHADNMLQPAPVLILDAASGRKISEWNPPTVAVGGAWTPGGLLIVTATEKALHIWRVQ